MIKHKGKGEHGGSRCVCVMLTHDIGWQGESSSTRDLGGVSKPTTLDGHTVAGVRASHDPTLEIPEHASLGSPKRLRGIGVTRDNPNSFTPIPGLENFHEL